jgi:uncharacterized protein YigE (DUF2233 family)
MRSCLHVVLFVSLLCTSKAGWTLERWKELGTLKDNAVAWEAEASSDGQTIRLSGITFEARDSVLRVIDNPPENRRSLESALANAGAFAGSNGGYFHPDFTPAGLAISEGRTVHPFERAKLLSGVLAVRKGGMELVRSNHFKPGDDIQDALQAGPWLVEKGAPVAGLNGERRARRTIVANDGRGNWVLVATSPVTLADAGRVLCLKGVAGSSTITNALNFDGGSSTALRATSQGRVLIDIGSLGAVRNYLAIVGRHR